MDKEKNVPKNIDEYIAVLPEDVKAIMESVRKVIHETAPDAIETMSYQIPTFDLHGNLVHFAAFKNHIGFYPTPSGMEAFREELSAYKGSKGSVQFPLNQPIPYDLITRIVKFRVQENLERAAKKAGKKK
ncbi:MAG TPA: DUF1801 domain-containing protein [Clostridiaceae bacterium]|nr:DUF1801 domain-containing protein [Clostridiaceae bacterium]